MRRVVVFTIGLVILASCSSNNSLHHGTRFPAQECGGSEPSTDLMSKCLPPNPNQAQPSSNVSSRSNTSSSGFGGCHYSTEYPPRIVVHDGKKVCAGIIGCDQGAEPDQAMTGICSLRKGTCPDATVCVNDNKVHQHPLEVLKIFCLDEDDGSGLPKIGCSPSGVEAPNMSGRY